MTKSHRTVTAGPRPKESLGQRDPRGQWAGCHGFPSSLCSSSHGAARRRQNRSHGGSRLGTLLGTDREGGVNIFLEAFAVRDLETQSALLNSGGGWLCRARGFLLNSVVSRLPDLVNKNTWHPVTFEF